MGKKGFSLPGRRYTCCPSLRRHGIMSGSAPIKLEISQKSTVSASIEIFENRIFFLSKIEFF